MLRNAIDIVYIFCLVKSAKATCSNVSDNYGSKDRKTVTTHFRGSCLYHSLF